VLPRRADRCRGKSTKGTRALRLIGHLIHTFGTGYETLGPKAPERHLRGLGKRIEEETMREMRVIKAFVPMTPDQNLIVGLIIGDDGHQVVTIEGREEYAGFSLHCPLPPKVVVIDLKPTIRQPITKQARLLYAACRTMPNAVEGGDFR
jgi:hypothetical protein